MSGYQIKLGDLAFEAMIYAARRRCEQMERSPEPEAKAQYALVEARINRAYPVVGVETIRFPHTHLTPLLDVMGLAVHTMNKTQGAFGQFRSCPDRHRLLVQKRVLTNYLTSDVVTRMASLA